MLDLSLAQLTELVKDAEHKQEGIWVRLDTGLKICLMGVQDGTTDLFTAKFFPCARNSRQYTIPYKHIGKLETEEGADGKSPLRFTRSLDYST
jgi:hypothetical protein